MGKIKVSLTLDEKVLHAVDREASRVPRSNRSAFIEAALRGWLDQRQQKTLHEEIATYYLQRSASEQQEDEAWAGLGDETIAGEWDDD